jgi:hypothetical protein
MRAATKLYSQQLIARKMNPTTPKRIGKPIKLSSIPRSGCGWGVVRKDNRENYSFNKSENHIEYCDHLRGLENLERLDFVHRAPSLFTIANTQFICR